MDASGRVVSTQYRVGYHPGVARLANSQEVFRVYGILLLAMCRHSNLHDDTDQDLSRLVGCCTLTKTDCQIPTCALVACVLKGSPNPQRLSVFLLPSSEIPVIRDFGVVHGVRPGVAALEVQLSLPGTFLQIMTRQRRNILLDPQGDRPTRFEIAESIVPSIIQIRPVRRGIVGIPLHLHGTSDDVSYDAMAEMSLAWRSKKADEAYGFAPGRNARHAISDDLVMLRHRDEVWDILRGLCLPPRACDAICNLWLQQELGDTFDLGIKGVCAS